MQPTLTMRHLPTSEALVVECDHGLASAHGEDVVTHEQFGATLTALMARRSATAGPTPPARRPSPCPASSSLWPARIV